MMIEIAKPKFSLGKLVATPGALEALTEAGQSAMEFISRHARGDWGDCCDEDRQANEDALLHGARLLSAYRTAKGVKVWVMTRPIEARRACCCLRSIDVAEGDELARSLQTTILRRNRLIPRTVSPAANRAAVGGSGTAAHS